MVVVNKEVINPVYEEVRDDNNDTNWWVRFAAILSNQVIFCRITMGRGISRICQIKNLVISNLYNVTQVRLFYALEVLMVVIFFFCSKRQINICS